MNLHEAIAITYALMGQSLSDAALEVACNDLKGYPIPLVGAALERCRKECKHIALAEIIARIEETKALTPPCARCGGSLANGRNLTMNQWVCDTCREDYLAGKWAPKTQGATA